MWYSWLEQNYEIKKAEDTRIQQTDYSQIWWKRTKIHLTGCMILKTRPSLH